MHTYLNIKFHKLILNKKHAPLKGGQSPNLEARLNSNIYLKKKSLKLKVESGALTATKNCFQPIGAAILAPFFFNKVSSNKKCLVF